MDEDPWFILTMQEPLDEQPKRKDEVFASAVVLHCISDELLQPCVHSSMHVGGVGTVALGQWDGGVKGLGCCSALLLHRQLEGWRCRWWGEWRALVLVFGIGAALICHTGKGWVHVTGSRVLQSRLVVDGGGEWREQAVQ